MFNMHLSAFFFLREKNHTAEMNSFDTKSPNLIGLVLETSKAILGATVKAHTVFPPK